MQVKQFCIATIFVLGTNVNAKTKTSNEEKLADFRIRELVSVSIDSNSKLLRAVKGYDEIYPFVIIEKIQLPMTEGEESSLLNSWKVNSLPGGKDLFPLVEGEDIQDLKWVSKDLSFTLLKKGKKLNCLVTGFIESLPKLNCKK